MPDEDFDEEAFWEDLDHQKGQLAKTAKVWNQLPRMKRVRLMEMVHQENPMDDVVLIHRFARLKFNRLPPDVCGDLQRLMEANHTITHWREDNNPPAAEASGSNDNNRTG